MEKTKPRTSEDQEFIDRIKKAMDEEGYDMYTALKQTEEEEEEKEEENY